MPSEYRKWGSQANHPLAVDLPKLTLLVPQNEEECALSLKETQQEEEVLTAAVVPLL